MKRIIFLCILVFGAMVKAQTEDRCPDLSGRYLKDDHIELEYTWSEELKIYKIYSFDIFSDESPLIIYADGHFRKDDYGSLVIIEKHQCQNDVLHTSGEYISESTRYSYEIFRFKDQEENLIWSIYEYNFLENKFYFSQVSFKRI